MVCVHVQIKIRLVGILANLENIKSKRQSKNKSQIAYYQLICLHVPHFQLLNLKY